MRIHRAIAVTGLMAAAGCGQSQQQAMQESGAAAAAPAERQENLITREEIEQSRASNVYDAISTLRRNFLSNRGATTIRGSATSLPVVYMDGVLFGALDALKNMSTSNVSTIRLYRAWEAAKFGADKTGGVIEITSRKQ